MKKLTNFLNKEVSWQTAVLLVVVTFISLLYGFNVITL